MAQRARRDHGRALFAVRRTYRALLGPLGQEPTVWTECLFADPVVDIAVLGAPDGQELPEQCTAYEALVMAVKPLRASDKQRKNCSTHNHHNL
jgi:hypothetical protein